jgi:preprotein translocase subunit YajC
LIPVISFLLAEADNGSNQGGGAVGGGLMTLVIFVLFIAVFYFLLIRPSQKQRKAHEQLVAGLKKGDVVMTAGGLYGTITQVKDDYVMLEIAKKIEVKVSRNSVARREEAGKRREETED